MRMSTCGTLRLMPSTSGRPCRKLGSSPSCPRVASQARRACSSAAVKGGPQKAMIASPTYLSMIPPLRRIGSDMVAR